MNRQHRNDNIHISIDGLTRVDYPDGNYASMTSPAVLQRFRLYSYTAFQYNALEELQE